MTEAEVMVVDTNITDHRMVVLSVRVCANRTDRQIDTSPASSGPSYRIDYVKLKTTLDSVDWKDVYSDTNPNKFFSENQFGFREGLSTEVALKRFMDLVYESLNSGKKLVEFS
ncbi:hypothetical protein J6590_052453 [Homalodisca vitripennis]|nr:hypothetical protein J6590_052453 [Homalodisca vitripennis]